MTGLSVAKPEKEVQDSLPHALPAWVYNNADMTRLELERILLPSWQIVCHVNSIPKPGDFETMDLGPESIFVMRDRDGSIRAFHNVCRHRGARLLDGAAGAIDTTAASSACRCAKVFRAWIAARTACGPCAWTPLSASCSFA